MSHIYRALTALLSTFALIFTIGTLGVVNTSPASAAIQCQGRVGQPLWINEGPRNPIVLRIGSSQNNIYVGHPEYYCPTDEFTHAFQDVYMTGYINGNRVGSYLFWPYGWNKIPSWLRLCDEVYMTEYYS